MCSVTLCGLIQAGIFQRHPPTPGSREEAEGRTILMEQGTRRMLGQVSGDAAAEPPVSLAVLLIDTWNYFYVSDW